jgi:hypothetical protein
LRTTDLVSRRRTMSLSFHRVLHLGPAVLYSTLGPSPLVSLPPDKPQHIPTEQWLLSSSTPPVFETLVTLYSIPTPATSEGGLLAQTNFGPLSSRLFQSTPKGSRRLHVGDSLHRNSPSGQPKELERYDAPRSRSSGTIEGSYSFSKKTIRCWRYFYKLSSM